MSDAPHFHIDPADFHADPYPDLARMRAEAPICHVPELGATLMTRRDDIFTQEKRIDVYSSVQPDGLMAVLMGENMMRKDGTAHAADRKATFPTFSPRTVRDHWKQAFQGATRRVLHDLRQRGHADLVADFALPVSAEALRVVTGLANMEPAEMDRVSQGMIDGISNYQGDPGIEANCRNCTARIDAHIDDMAGPLRRAPNLSLLSVQLQAGVDMASVRANIKLAISGGQNEPRDAIAGTVWALLRHPDQHALINSGDATWQQAFGEYTRWISPIGMSPRRIARPDQFSGVSLAVGDRIFFMYGSANRDEAVFDDPEKYCITRDTSKSLAFGAGPHFCAGAAISRSLIAEVALPMLFDSLPNLKLDGKAPISGWAFRGLTKLPVVWDT